MAHQIGATQKTVHEIVNMPWTPLCQQYVFTVVARVEGVHGESGWYYMTCYKCSKKLQVIEGSCYCNICNQQCWYPMIRYRVCIAVADQSNGTIFALYNKEAESLLDTSASKLANRLGLGTNALPREIMALTGRTFSFKIRLPDYYDEDSDFHNYRVVDLFEIESTPAIVPPVVPQPKVAGNEKKRGCTQMSLDDSSGGGNVAVGSSGQEIPLSEKSVLVGVITPEKTERKKVNLGK